MRKLTLEGLHTDRKPNYLIALSFALVSSANGQRVDLHTCCSNGSSFSFERSTVGNALRLCRVDKGVLSRLKPSRAADGACRGGAGCAKVKDSCEAGSHIANIVR